MTSEQETTSAAPADEGQQAPGPGMPRLPLPPMPAGMPTGTPGRMLWWGGLAALAALDVVEWPVAVLVGAGSWVAEQYAKAAATQQPAKTAQEQHAGQPHAA